MATMVQKTSASVLIVSSCVCACVKLCHQTQSSLFA